MVTRETFIENLSSQLIPEKPIVKPYTRFFLWLAFSLLSITSIMLYIQNFRPNFISQLTNSQFLLESLLSIGTVATSGLLFFYLSVPGIKTSKLTYYLCVIPFFGF